MRHIRSFLRIVGKFALLSALVAKLLFLKLRTKILVTKPKIAFTEEPSMERYAIYDDNPLAIDYRVFSLLSNSNLKLIAIGMTFKDKSRQKPTCGPKG